MLSIRKQFERNNKVHETNCLTSFDPYNPDQKLYTKPKKFSLRIVGGRHLFGLGQQFHGSNTSKFDFTVEILGISQDKTHENKYVFKQEVPYNSFNPVFHDKGHVFTVANPDLAFLKFTLSSADAFGDPQPLGVACFAMNGLRSGFRSVPLCNSFLEPISHASLLVHSKFLSETTSVPK
jgi:phosphatidylinositol phospholipase C gamma-1